MQNQTLILRPSKPSKPATKLIPLHSGTGVPKGTATLVQWTESVLRTTHNGDTRFNYQTGIDADGIEYETKSRGFGWRVKR